MKTVRVMLQHKNVINKASVWVTKTLKDAIKKDDLIVQITSHVILAICDPLHKNSIPYEDILQKKSSEYFIKTTPLFFVEFLFLMKKNQPELYTNEIKNLIENYQTILKELNNDEPDDIDILILLNKVNKLQVTTQQKKETVQLNVSEDDFLMKTKNEVDKKLNTILKSSKFGLHKINMKLSTFEAIETIMLDAAKNYDLMLVTKALKVLMYTGIKSSYVINHIVDFLINNQSIEGYIGHYDVAFKKTNSSSTTIKKQQLQITKEIITVITLYYNNLKVDLLQDVS